MHNQQTETNCGLGAAIANGIQSLLDLIEYTTEETGKSENVELLKYLLEIAKESARDLQAGGTEALKSEESQQTGHLSA